MQGAAISTAILPTALDPPASSEPVRRENLLDSFAKRLTCKKARMLVGKYGFTSSDRDDIEQELTLDLLQRSPKFDPQRCTARKFVVWVVRKKLYHLIRARLRDKRRKVFGGKSVECLSKNIEVGRPRGGDCDEAVQRELALDVRSVLEQLPRSLRDVAERLQFDSISQVARDLGVPRSTLRSMLKKIRERFEAAGLDANF